MPASQPSPTKSIQYAICYICMYISIRPTVQIIIQCTICGPIELKSPDCLAIVAVLVSMLLSLGVSTYIFQATRNQKLSLQYHYWKCIFFWFSCCYCCSRRRLYRCRLAEFTAVAFMLPPFLPFMWMPYFRCKETPSNLGSWNQWLKLLHGVLLILSMVHCHFVA